VVKERGFTFVELLYVVSIIGIQAAIAIPQFSQYRARAYQAEAYSLLLRGASESEHWKITYPAVIKHIESVYLSPAFSTDQRTH